jgi:hypothetical protein
MKRKYSHYSVFIALLFTVILFVNSCKKDDETVSYSKINLKAEYKVDGNPLVLNVMNYINEAGNHYGVTEIQWFISDLTLYKKGQAPFNIIKTGFYHYFDTGVPTTQTWEITDDIPVGAYDSISFIFGFTPEQNISFMINNPPASAMWWPDNLGGGYHYMKLNGFWKDTIDFKRAFNFHMGIGRIINGTDTIFEHNYFKVTFNTPIELLADKKKEITIAMNIDEWFKNPHTWDFNYWGPAIMENEKAMRTAKENGQVGVFTITSVKDL